MKIKARLYCPDINLVPQHYFSLDLKQAHYIRHVMRAQKGEFIGIFNGLDGEYACEVTECDKKNLVLQVISKIRDHLKPDPICLIFAVIKKSPLEYLIQKATELGVGILQPITTDRTIIRELNTQRLETITIEAAEQCCLTALPILNPIKSLREVICNFQHILFCDERGQAPPIATIAQTHPIDAILIGPEGGFSPSEADFLYSQKNCYPVSLGKRIMRAETAAIASLAIVQNI